MALYFFDASAIVKYFHNEPGTAWIKQIVDLRDAASVARVNQIYITDASLAEVPAAFAILERGGRISRSVRDLMYDKFLKSTSNEFQLLRITTERAFAAGELTQKYPLRGYDAIQLAIALDLNHDLKPQGLVVLFVSGDNALLQAARAEGLAAENPFDHQ
jgi:predicted nucleic acid-binding protein